MTFISLILKVETKQLLKMKNDKNKKIPKDTSKANEFPGYQNYPAKEDIYSMNKEEEDLDPENILKMKSPNEKPDEPNEKDFGDIVTGSDLDIPGSEQDDAQEDIGSEDEENNYYSLGGDNHNNLDENKT